MRKLVVLDVSGTRSRAVAGTSGFEEIVESIPHGPTQVTLRFEPNEVNPYGISALVGDQQVGYLQTEWSADDLHVAWMMRLDAAGIAVRFDGECRPHPAGGNIINFLTPERTELAEVAEDLVARTTGAVE